MHIEPTVGRVVWFHPAKHDRIMVPGGFPIDVAEQPLAATIAYVHRGKHAGLINIGFLCARGGHHNKESVRLLQDGDEIPLNESYCAWMPYQMGQAVKTEAAEAAVRLNAAKAVSN
jgi:hypothetical protein